MADITQAELAQLKKQFQPLIGVQFTSLALPAAALEAFEPSQIGTIVGALMDAARKARVTVRRVTVQSTTLDDVFLHYTGRQLRDEIGGAARLDIKHLYK